ncbi:hypothetical protein HOLleu_00788 [Holothuria leucospilota]|uniref:Uncharacterized protein n=1 Tax=Holothuria leucospilota TaxID=206669 RepID=A0A9Q1HG18_HOLLE|nr:hypothetical protein HOLleu_00788 [Holothuria leucospilota]
MNRPGPQEVKQTEQFQNVNKTMWDLEVSSTDWTNLYEVKWNQPLDPPVCKESANTQQVPWGRLDKGTPNIRTPFRKHLAAACQVMNLKKRELQGLPSFVGHNIRVHENFYRLPEDILQAGTSEILLAIGYGIISEYKGENLDETHFRLVALLTSYNLKKGRL